MKIGVLALQGAFIEHRTALRSLGIDSVETRLPEDLEGLDGLILPGGESTTILKLMHSYAIFPRLQEMILKGFPILGLCAGMICLAKQVSNSRTSPLDPLGVMDIAVKRNAFGRQVESFETGLSIPVLGSEPFPAVFIRAPLIDAVGPRVEVLARLENGVIVAAQQGNILVSSFHPELTEDLRFHRYFINIIQANNPRS